ncbi:hypothetical protein [Pseudomonas sp.]|uniref:hypothetical protein n=1 Tax=Pseudomonas sp. TaxID=306 RepID=UPI0028AC54A8|nr:hypothetical protein [Pseudomonas sp.]
MNLIQGLLVLVVLLAGLSMYFWVKLKGVENNEEVQPLDTGFIAWVALVFVFVIVTLYVYFGENAPVIPENVGQIGDFIGGLTNPVLSFLALLVLLRTTRIQTLEARKTTAFMREQQKIMEVEKFENTFFQLIAQLESHCEKHFRAMIEGESYGEQISESLWETYDEYGKLPAEEQLDRALKNMENLTGSADCVILAQRAMRVVKFINNSKLPKGTRQSYASILRDTIYPSECIVVLGCMYKYEVARKLLKEWRIVDLSKGYFPCPEIEKYFYPERFK